MFILSLHMSALCVICVLLLYLHMGWSSLEDVTVSMETEAINQLETEGNVRICATLTASTTIMRRIEVQFSQTGPTNRTVKKAFQSGSESGSMRCYNVMPVIDDMVFEDDEVYTVSLSSSQNQVTATGTTTVTIVDDDDVTISMQNDTISHTKQQIKVCAKLEAPMSLGKNVTVEFLIKQTSSQIRQSVIKTFASGSLQNSVQCLTTNDIVIEDNEVYTVSLSSSQDRVTATGTTTVTVINNNDDGADQVTVSMQNDTISHIEMNGNVEVCARLDTPMRLGKNVEVQFHQTGQTRQTVTKIFPSGSLAGSLQCHTIRIMDDMVIEDNEVYTVSVSSSQDRVTASGTTTVTVVDDDGVTISMRDVEISHVEGNGNVAVCAMVNAPMGIGKNVMVQFHQTGPTGQTAMSTKTFRSGSTVECLTITVVDDMVFEDNEVYTVSVSSSQDRVTATGTTTVIVKDDDDATVSMRDEVISHIEGNGNVTVCAMLNAPMRLEKNIMVQFHQIGPTRQTVMLTKTFPSGSTAGSMQCHTIAVVDDMIFRDNRVYTVRLSSSQDRVTASGTTTVTVVDKGVRVSIQNDTIISRVEGNGNFKVCARLYVPMTIEKDVEIQFHLTGQTRQTVPKTFLSGSLAESLSCFTITVVDNTVFEDNEVYTVSLSSSQDRVTASGTTTVTVVDDDGVTVSMRDSRISSAERNGNIEVCSMLSASMSVRKNVVVQFQLTGPNTPSQSVTKTFRSGSTVGSLQCHTIPVMDDMVFEDNEVYTVSVSSSQDRVTASGTTTVTIVDDDDPVIAFQQTTYNGTVMEGNTSTFGVCAILKKPLGGLGIQFTVHFSISAGTANEVSDYEAESNNSLVTRTFPTWFTPNFESHRRCIRFSVVDDSVGEPRETFFVNISPNDSRVTVERSPRTTITIIDNDIVTGLTPQNFNVVVTGSRNLSFSWEAPAENTDYAIIGYTIVCNSQSHTFAKNYSTEFPLPYEENEFIPYTEYECAVSARLAYNMGQPAISQPVQTLEEAPGSTPRNVMLKNRTSSSLQLSWDPPKLSFGVITHYTIYINFTNGSDIINRNSPNNSFTITHLFPYQNVIVEVSASNSAGEGESRKSFTSRTSESYPGKVVDVSYRIMFDQKGLNFEWSEPEKLNGVLLHYLVRVRTLFGESIRTMTAISARLTLTELEPFIPYEVMISAVNNAGEGSVHTEYVFAEEGVPQSVPQNVSVERLNSGSSMRVSWESLSLLESRGFITNYTVHYWIQGRSMDTAMDHYILGNITKTVIDGLDPKAAYLVSVSASTSAGMGNSTESFILESTSYDQSIQAPGPIVGGVIIGAITGVILVICVLILIWKLKAKGLMKKINKEPIATVELKQNDLIPTSLKLLQDEKSTIADHSTDILKADFAEHVWQMHKDTDREFAMEYQSIENPGYPCSVALLPCNKTKNRFLNIFPYDNNRVILESTDTDGSDYINASWLNGYKTEKAYIAAQGPVPNSVGDFWKMIWEYKLPTIVMLTRLVENAREKCQRYWPEKIGDSVQYMHGFVVTLEDVKPFSDYVIQTLKVKTLKEPDEVPHKVLHCQYQGWPDHGVPQYATSLLGFLRRVRKSHPHSSTSPLVVHCSAGVGRTGTFIALDVMLQKIKYEGCLNVYQYVTEMRKQRPLLVQTESQYIFIHDALDEFISCGDTEIDGANFRIAINKLSKRPKGKLCSGFEEQFQLLEQVCRCLTQNDHDYANDSETYYKNRYQDKIPYAMSSIYLRSTGQPGSEYINASFIEGYKSRRAFIATQGPLDQTIGDFWRMVKETKCQNIVMLCNLEEDGEEVCSQYWPSGLKCSAVYEKTKVTLLSEEHVGEVIIRKLELSPTNDKSHPLMPKSETTVVTQFHHTAWNENGTQPSPKSMLQLNDLLVKAQISTGNKPITVMCNDGCGRTGTFLTIYTQIERLKTEGVIDVLQNVKAIRNQRTDLVGNVEQYILIHDVLASYADTFDTYANFQDEN